MINSNRHNRPGAAALPSTRAWLVVHLLFPLLPFFAGTLVRFLSCLSASWAVLDASEFALSFCFISLFVRQSLLGSEILLTNQDKEDEVAEFAALCLIVTLLFFGLFATLEVFSMLVNDRRIIELETSLRWAQVVVFVLGPPSMCLFIGIQKCFKLRARVR